FGNRATREHDVVDIPRHFPGILRLQDPGITDADYLCRILKVMERDPETIHGAVHGAENAVVNRQPSPVRFERRRTWADLHLVPVIGFGLYEELGTSPEA